MSKDNGFFGVASHWSNVGRCDDGLIIGNCDKCGAVGAIIFGHKCKPSSPWKSQEESPFLYKRREIYV